MSKSIYEQMELGIVTQYVNKHGMYYLNGEFIGIFLIAHVTPEMYNKINEWFVRTFNKKGDISR